MDRKSFRNMCMAAGGMAMMATSTAMMYAAPSVSSVEAIGDMAKVAAVVAAALGVSGTIVATIGLAPLIWKYGEKFYNYVKQKIKEKYHLSEKEADKMMENAHAQSKDAKSSSNGKMKENLKSGFNRGSFINHSSRRRSAHNPVSRSNNVKIYGTRVER